MLDFNHRPKVADHVNAAVDAALVAENTAQPRREYLGGSRLGHPCERALQFEFAGAPKDEGAGFSGSWYGFRGALARASGWGMRAGWAAVQARRVLTGLAGSVGGA